MVGEHHADVETSPVAEDAGKVGECFVEFIVPDDRQGQKDRRCEQGPYETWDGAEKGEHGLEVQPDAVDRR